MFLNSLKFNNEFSKIIERLIKIMKDLKIFLVLIVLTNVALCWWDPGHMLVAKVAELDLKDRSIRYIKQIHKPSN